MIKYSVGIVTFDKRFDKYFKPLITQIKKLRPDIEIMVCVNGPHEAEFDPVYRQQVMEFCSLQNNVYINMFPNFRSLAKLWNNLLINASNHHMLMLNDDVSIDDTFFDNLETVIADGGKTFKISGSWSHVFLDRRYINAAGWFDERYLGVGEEDGDMEWEIQDRLGDTIQDIRIEGLTNHVDPQDVLQNIKKVNGKYTEFNARFMHEGKFIIDAKAGKSYGINPRPLRLVMPKPPLHSTEMFYWSNKGQL